MASFHLTVKAGKCGSANNHAAYIAREGKYGKDLQEEELVIVESGNLPDWTNGNPSSFWKAADKFERKNGAVYREFELALPVELTTEQQVNLVETFIAQAIGEKPYQYAIHAPIASLGEMRQPHAHVMFSDRAPDGIGRPPEQHFKRFNSNNPELGGCKKDSGGKLPADLKQELINTRENWANLQNKFLEKHGHEARVDHRSNRERNIHKEAERHLGQATIKKMTAEQKALCKLQRLQIY